MSKRFIIGKTGIAVLLSGIAVLFFCPGIAAAACNAPADDGCPLKINNQLVFDRCFGAPPIGPDAGKRTAVGNQICDILRDTNQVARRLGAGAAALQQSAQKDLKAFAEVTFNDAVDRKALEKFDTANGMLRRIESDIEEYKNDKFCGSKTAMDRAKKSFEADIGDLRIFGEGIAGTAEAATAMLPVAVETGNIVTEVGKLRAVSYNRGGSAVNSYNQLNLAANTLQNAANGLKTPSLDDIINTVNTGSTAVMDNLPFITNCAACAGALGVAAANIVGIAAQPSVAMTTCLPTAGTGCIVAAAGAGLNAYSAVVFIAVADPFCRNAAAKVDDMDINTGKVRRFFESTAKMIDQVDKTDEGINNVGTQLNQLYRDLGDQAKPSIDKINTSLKGVHGALERGKEILRKKVLPKVNQFTGNRFEMMINQAKQVVHCYGNMGRLAGSLSNDVQNSAKEMSKASGKIVDAGKVLDNIIGQGQAAGQAGSNYAYQEWKACDAAEAALHRDIWGVERGKFDPGKTGGHLAYLAANPNKIPALARRVANLNGREATIPLRALEEGKKSFLNLAKSKTDSGRLFDEAEALASGAARRIAKAQAKEKAKEEAARQKGVSTSTGPLKAANAAPMPALNVEALKPLPMRR